MSTNQRMDAIASARIAGQQLANSQQTTAIPVGPQNHGSSDAPQIEVVRQGEVVQALDITCSCGCQMRVLCEYDSSP
jgi:hypothetical protein